MVNVAVYLARSCTRLYPLSQYLEFRQFVQHALLVKPLLGGAGGGGGGHGRKFYTARLFPEAQPLTFHVLFFIACEQALERPGEFAYFLLTNATPFIYLV